VVEGKLGHPCPLSFDILLQLDSSPSDSADAILLDEFDFDKDTILQRLYILQQIKSMVFSACGQGKSKSQEVLGYNLASDRGKFNVPALFKHKPSCPKGRHEHENGFIVKK
jgi:hypothetical protein